MSDSKTWNVKFVTKALCVPGASAYKVAEKLPGSDGAVNIIRPVTDDIKEFSSTAEGVPGDHANKNDTFLTRLAFGLSDAYAAVR